MHEVVRSFEHRDVQTDCLDAIKQARLEGRKSGLINMATGLGKTYIAARDAKEYLQENPDARFLYVCHNTDILRQARGTFEEVLGTDVGHGYVFDGQSNDQQQIVYASFQTLNGRDKLYQALDPKEFDYVIDDESHHAMARTHKEVLQYLQPKFLLGLSATPERRDGRDIMDIFGTEIYRKTLEEALAEGLLTPVKYKTFTDHLQRVGDVAALIERIGMGELNKTLFIPRRDEEIAEILFDEMTQINNPHGLVFAQSIEHAERMAALLPDAVAIHSKLKNGHERELKQAFSYGEIPVAVVVDKYNEGVDVPTLNFLAPLRSTTSFRIWRQQLGRGLRPYVGKDEVRVADLAPSFERIQMVLDLEAGVRKVLRGEQLEGEAREFNPEVSFDFSEEARDAVEIIKRARSSYERSRDRYRKPLEELPAIDTVFEFADGEREMHFEPMDVLFLKSIWTNEQGHLSTRELQALYQQQFRSKIQQKELNEYLRGLSSRGILSHVAFVRGEKGSKLWRVSDDVSDLLAAHEYFQAEHDQAVLNLHQVIADRANLAMGDSRVLPNFVDLIKTPREHVETPQDINDQVRVLFNESEYTPSEPDAVTLEGNLGYSGEFEKSDITGAELNYLLKIDDWDKHTPSTLSNCRVSTKVYVFQNLVVMRLEISGAKSEKGYGQAPYLKHIHRNLTPGEINTVTNKLSSYSEIMHVNPTESKPVFEYKDQDHREIYRMLEQLDEVRADRTKRTFLEDPSEPADLVGVDYQGADKYEAGLIFSRFEDYPDLLDRLKNNMPLVEALQVRIEQATWRSEEYRNKLKLKLDEIRESFKSEI